MNKERTLEQIKVMQAWVEGKTIMIQFPDKKVIQAEVEPMWDWSTCFYYVKPEPRTIWVSFCLDGTPGLVTESEEIAKRWKSSCTNCIAKFTEVLDGQC